MKRSISLLASLMVPVFMLAVANPAIAQDKMKDAKAAPMAKDAKAAPAAKAEKGKVTTEVLHEDDRVRVIENTSRPGDVTSNIVRGLRVVRFLKGGTVERTYADGKKEKLERKVGQVLVAGPDKQAYFQKNIGKTTIVSYVVQIKEAKK